MALAYTHIELFYAFKQQGELSKYPINSIMEFGEQNWYGDIHPSELKSVIDTFYKGKKLDAMQAELNEALAKYVPENEYAAFDMAKFFYRVIFDYETYHAIDLHGTPIALRHDLNTPVELTEQFDLITNLGTSEHVFNQYQFFKNVHDLVKPNGLMIHSIPNQGAYDHGFYNYHPTFIFDLSSANNYEVVCVIYSDGTTKPNTLHSIDRVSYVKLALEGKLSNYSGLTTILRCPGKKKEFQSPQQGYYDNTLPAELSKAWNEMDR
jgi:SAM-dependent methyltransferase